MRKGNILASKAIRKVLKSSVSPVLAFGSLDLSLFSGN